MPSWAVSSARWEVDQLLSGVSALAVPVFNGFGEFVLCLTAIGPSATLRMGPDSLAAQHLRDAAQVLSQRLGAPAASAGGH